MLEKEMATLKLKLKDAERMAEEHKERLIESQISFEAKLDEEREDARRMSKENERLAELKAKSEQDLKEAQRLAEERKELLDELKKTTAPMS